MAHPDMARLKREAYVAPPERWVISMVRSAPLGLRSLVAELDGKLSEDELILLAPYGPAAHPEQVDTLLYFLATTSHGNITYDMAMADPDGFRNVVDRLSLHRHYPIEYFLPRGATFAMTYEQVVQHYRAGVAVQADTIFRADSQLAVQAPPAITADGLTIYHITSVMQHDIKGWLWAGCPDWWWLDASEQTDASRSLPDHSGPELLLATVLVLVGGLVWRLERCCVDGDASSDSEEDDEPPTNMFS